MNNLSWMIYLAELSGSVSGFLTFLAIASAVVAIASIAGWLSTMGNPYCWSWDDKDMKIADHKRVHHQLRRIAPRAAVALLVFGLTSTFLPSKGTVYAIAASEMGEQLLDTPTAGKAVKALDAWLDRQIAGDTPPASDAK